MKKSIPINPMPNGNARPIKAQYQQTSLANLIRGGGLGATGVITYERINIREQNIDGVREISNMVESEYTRAMGEAAAEDHYRHQLPDKHHTERKNTEGGQGGRDDPEQ